MSNFFVLYIAAWGAACLIAIGLMIRYRQTIELFTPQYRKFLLQGWKIVTFLISASGLIVIAPYTGDPTWDYVDSSFMALLTFYTAPWVVGILFLAAKRQVELAKFYIAVCVWMFSASWSYDLYILLRDGYYPGTWLSNVFASSAWYLAAGLLWSLEWGPERGVIFRFMRPGWPETDTPVMFSKIIWYALLFIIFVIATTIPFLING